MGFRTAAAERSAMIIRIVSVPPVMAAILVAVLAVFRRNVVSTWGDVLLSLLFLSLLPAAAYPLSELIPSVKCRGREYLRIIYGAEYLESEHLERLKKRSLSRKRALALRDEIMARYHFKDAIVLESAGVSTLYAADGGIVVAY